MEFTAAQLPRPTPIAAVALSTIRHMAVESRPAVQAVFLLRFASMGVVALDLASAVVLGAVGWLHITTAIYVLNGMSDLNGDRANGSNRPLAVGLLGIATARSAVAICALTGLALSFTTSLTLGMLSTAMLLLGLGYSYGPCWKAGRHSACCVIGAGAALTYSAGAAAGGAMTSPALSYTAMLSIWIAFASVSKDFSDTHGDRLTGRRTAPVELGHAQASRALTISTTLAAAALVAVSTACDHYWMPTIAIVSGTAALTVALLLPQEPASRSRSRRPYRIYMVTQYAAGAALLATAVT